jgi:hypothetical protein
MLVIKIDAEKSKENYNAAIGALSNFDVVSAAWETEDAPKVADPQIKSGQSGEGLSSAVSAAVKFLSEQNRNRG